MRIEEEGRIEGMSTSTWRNVTFYANDCRGTDANPVKKESTATQTQKHE